MQRARIVDGHALVRTKSGCKAAFDYLGEECQVWRRLPERVRYLIVGFAVGSVVTMLALNRYYVFGSERYGAYKLDRLTGRMWWVCGATQTPVTSKR